MSRKRIIQKVIEKLQEQQNENVNQYVILKQNKIFSSILAISFGFGFMYIIKMGHDNNNQLINYDDEYQAIKEAQNYLEYKKE